MEADLQKQRDDALAQKRIGGNGRRPQIGSRACEYSHKPDEQEVPQWVTELTCRPAQDCVVVTEIEEVEDIDAD